VQQRYISSMSKSAQYKLNYELIMMTT